MTSVFARKALSTLAFGCLWLQRCPDQPGDQQVDTEERYLDLRQHGTLHCRATSTRFETARLQPSQCSFARTCAAVPNAILNRVDMRNKVYQAFAALAGDGRARTLHTYTQWVAKLAQNEFADELVVLATSLELRVRITCVPYTPLGATPWAISQYPPPGSDVTSDIMVYLGNDDVHYVWLAPITP